jgi:hypothetical protein
MSRHRSRINRLLVLLALVWPGGVSPGWADYEVIEVSDGGTVKGQALWKGAIPQLPSPALQIDPATKGVQDVLVYLERVEQGKAAEPVYRLPMGKGASVPGQTCQFIRTVFPFVRTSPVGMINLEPVLHNPHFFTEKQASLFNLALPTPDREITTTLLRARGVGLRLLCDVHVHLNA